MSLNIVMHELLPELRPGAMANALRALKPGGVLISNDFHYPSRIEDFREPRHAIGPRAVDRG